MSCIEIKQIFLLQVEKEEAKQKRAFKHTNYGVWKGVQKREPQYPQILPDGYQHQPKAVENARTQDFR